MDHLLFGRFAKANFKIDFSIYRDFPLSLTSKILKLKNRFLKILHIWKQNGGFFFIMETSSLKFTILAIAFSSRSPRLLLFPAHHARAKYVRRFVLPKGMKPRWQ